LFGFTIGFLGFSIVIIWATVLEPRSQFPTVVNGVYWTTSALFAVCLAAGAGARVLAESGSRQVIDVLYMAPHVAQIVVFIALIVLVALTGHRLVTGPPEEDEEGQTHAS